MLGKRCDIPVLQFTMKLYRGHLTNLLLIEMDSIALDNEMLLLDKEAARQNVGS